MRVVVAHHGGVERRRVGVGRAGGQPLRGGRWVDARRQDVLGRRATGRKGRPRLLGGGLAHAQVQPGVARVVRRLGGVLVLPLARVLEVELCQIRKLGVKSQVE